jgi:hypothetical protein
MKTLLLTFSDKSSKKIPIPESFEELTFEKYLSALNAPNDWPNQVAALTGLDLEFILSLDFNSSIILRKTIGPLFIPENLLQFDSPEFAGLEPIEIENEPWNLLEIAKKKIAEVLKEKKDLLNSFPEILSAYRPEITKDEILSGPVSKWYGLANFFLSGLIGSLNAIENLTTNQATPTS